MSAGAAAVLLAAVAGWLVVRPPMRLERRRPQAFGSRPAAPSTAAVRSLTPRLAWIPGTCAVALLLTGHPAAAVALAVLTAALVLRGRTGSRARRAARSALDRDVPRLAGLLASCLDAGATPVEAVLAVGAHSRGPAGDSLLRVGRSLAAGAAPDEAWRGARGQHPALDRLADAFHRAADSGAPLAGTLAGLADDESARLADAAEVAARRAGVRAVGPLALCFLPAFLLVGVVPVVAGITAGVAGSLP